MLWSMVKKKLSAEPARERIVNTAVDLFYQQGYRATGINEVIEKSGVAKATFYNHFPTKDDLCQAYLEAAKNTELAMIDTAIRSAEGPLERFMAPLGTIHPWLIQTNFRGCGFVNIAAEIPDPKSPLRRAGMQLYDSIMERMETLATELIASDRKKYGHLEPKALCDDYMMAFGGAVALAEIYHDIWPIERAISTVQRLLDR